MLARIAAAHRNAVPPADPYWANVVSLLHFNGAQGSTAFTDEKGKAWARGGNAVISEAVSRFGGASLALNGAGDYLQAPTSADWAFGTADFTVEAWLWHVAPVGGGVSNDRMVFGGFPSAAMAFFLTNSSNKPALWDGVTQSTSALAIPTQTFTHVAWCRAGGVLRIFVAGQVGLEVAAYNHNFSAQGTFRIGNASTDGSRNYNGYIDEFRITKGVGRYAATFAPPSAPFPNQ